MKEPAITRKWIEAGKILGTDPEAKVPCPVCNHEFLVVSDVPISGSRKFERVLSCPNCGAKNVLLMNAKD